MFSILFSLWEAVACYSKSFYLHTRNIHTAEVKERAKLCVSPPWAFLCCVVSPSPSKKLCLLAFTQGEKKRVFARAFRGLSGSLYSRDDDKGRWQKWNNEISEEWASAGLEWGADSSFCVRVLLRWKFIGRRKFCREPIRFMFVVDDFASSPFRLTVFSNISCFHSFNKIPHN